MAHYEYLAVTKVNPTMSEAIRRLGFSFGIPNGSGDNTVVNTNSEYIGVAITEGQVRSITWPCKPSCWDTLNMSNEDMIKKIMSGEFKKPIIMVGEHRVTITSSGHLKVGCTRINPKTVEKIIKMWQSQ